MEIERKKVEEDYVYPKDLKVGETIEVGNYIFLKIKTYEASKIHYVNLSGGGCCSSGYISEDVQYKRVHFKLVEV